MGGDRSARRAGRPRAEAGRTRHGRREQTSPFPRALSLRVMILLVSIPGENAEGGGRMRDTRLALRVREDRKRAPRTRPPGDLSPSGPLSGTPDGRGSLARSHTSPPSLPGPSRLPGGLPVGTGPTPLRCATRTASRNARGFSGRHPGTAAGPLAGLPRREDSAGAGAGHLPQRPAPVPGRRPSAGRDGRSIEAGGEAGICGRVMPGRDGLRRLPRP